MTAWLGLAALAAGASAQVPATSSAPPPAAAALAAPVSAEAARLATIVQSFVSRGLFSGAVLVARGEQVLLDRAWGLADQTWQVPNAPGTRFLLASVSKQFTAAAVLRLVDQGKLGLDDPITLYGTTGDLLKWQRGLYGGTQGGRLLSATSLQAMTTPVRNGYALGLSVTSAPRRLSYGHSGGVDGFSTYLHYEPQTQLTVAVLANLEGAASQRLAFLLSQAANGVPLVLPEERKSISLPEAALERLQGSFGSAAPGPLWLRRRGDALWARLGREPWVRLVAEAPGRFYAPDVDAELHLELAPDGSALSATVPDLPGSPRLARSAVTLPALSAQPVFLRGSMNGWSTEHRLQAGSDGLLRVAIDLAAGKHAFKVATADWSTIDLGQAVPGAPLPGRGSVAMVGTGRNIGLVLDKASRCEFSVDGHDIVEPRVTLLCTAR